MVPGCFGGGFGRGAVGARGRRGRGCHSYQGHWPGWWGRRSRPPARVCSRAPQKGYVKKHGLVSPRVALGPKMGQNRPPGPRSAHGSRPRAESSALVNGNPCLGGCMVPSIPATAGVCVAHRAEICQKSLKNGLCGPVWACLGATGVPTPYTWALPKIHFYEVGVSALQARFQASYTQHRGPRG